MMKTKIMIAFSLSALLGLNTLARGQQADSVWTLQKCIQYALQQNITVQKTSLTIEINQANFSQAQAARFPSVSGTVGQTFSWSKSINANSEYGSYDGSKGTSAAINSSVILYNGGRLKNNIKQADLAVQSGKYDTETTKESISLSVLNAYLQVLYAEEQVKTSIKQVEVTTEELRLADERTKLGAIAKSDFLQVKSQLASEKLTLINAQNLLAINRVNLMQLLEIPVSPSFLISHPDFGASVSQNRNPIADTVYKIAVATKPQIKSAEINRQSAELNIDLAKAGFLPSLSLNGEVSTGYSNPTPALSFGNQMSNRITPSLGLSLSIPIYQNKQARTKVEIAKIGTKTADLNLSDTKNQLRKAIEQACVDVTAAEQKYTASLEQYQATQESYEVASEKFNNGLLNSVDYLIQKTNLNSSESTLLQSKYNLIFSYKTLDFYSGVSLAL
jgi:outer membrane protein